MGKTLCIKVLFYLASKHSLEYNIITLILYRIESLLCQQGSLIDNCSEKMSNIDFYHKNYTTITSVQRQLCNYNKH